MQSENSEREEKLREAQKNLFETTMMCLSPWFDRCLAKFGVSSNAQSSSAGESARLGVAVDGEQTPTAAEQAATAGEQASAAGEQTARTALPHGEAPSSITSLDEPIAALIATAKSNQQSYVSQRLQELFKAEATNQAVSPLAVLREATHFATEVLQKLQVPASERDKFDVEVFPDDIYDLYPRNFADVDESLTEPGLVWGVAKAWHHMGLRKQDNSQSHSSGIRE